MTAPRIIRAVFDHAELEAQEAEAQAEQLEQRAASLREEAATLRSLHAIAAKHVGPAHPPGAILRLADDAAA